MHAMRLLRRCFGSAPSAAAPSRYFTDEALVAATQYYFAQRPTSPAAAATAAAAPLLPPHAQPPLQLVIPQPGAPIPQLHELSLWELVRLLKVTEDMRGVAGFPRLRTELVLRHAVRLITAASWAQARAEDAAALHALAVHFADRASACDEAADAAAAASGGGAPGEDAAADELKRLRNVCKQHLSPAICALVEARAWPPVAVADIVHTLGARRLLSSAAVGALMRYAAAELPHASFEEALDLLLGLDACPELEVEGSSSSSSSSSGGAEGPPSRCAQADLDALFRASAGSLCEQLLAREEAAAAAAAAAAADIDVDAAASMGGATPLPVLSALALAIADRFDGAGLDAAEPPLDASGSDAPALGLVDLARAIGTCAAARLRAHTLEQEQLAASTEQPLAPPPPPPPTQQQPPAAPHAEGLLAGHALCIGRCLACMGVWHGALVGALGVEWGRRWGRAAFATLLPPRAAADALLMANLGLAQGLVPPFPPPPLRLSATWNDTGRLLLLMNGQGRGQHARPLLHRPYPHRPIESAFVGAFASAWEERRRSAGPSSLEAEVLGHECSHPAGAGSSSYAYVTAEGCVLDIAIVGAQCGVKLVRRSDCRPGRQGLKASLLAEQCILEAAGWTVEYVLEADLGHQAKAAQVARRLLAAEVERRVGRG